MDPAAAQKIVEALDRELFKRRRKKYEALLAQWNQEGDGDRVYVFCRDIEHQLANGPWPDEFFSEPTDPEERWRLDEFFDEMGGIEGVTAEIADVAGRLLGREKALEAQRNGAPRRRPVIIGPRVRPVAGLGREPKAASENGKTGKKSRTELWPEQQEAQAAARQHMLPPRPVPPTPQPSDMGWHRGLVQHFDQIGATGVVKFSGMAGVSEAPIAPDAARRSGHTNFFPGEKVDCKLIRHLDGSVVVADLKLAAGYDPRSSPLSKAAEADRYRLQLSRNKWML
jgi:hypothetical protein